MNHLLMYDEKVLAEDILKEGFQNGSYNWHEALLVAKYFRQIYEFGDSRIKTELKDFCSSRDPFFYPEARINTIKNLIRRSKNVLIDYSDPIDIREVELGQIRSIKNFKFQQIALGILSIAKRNLKYSNGYVNRYCWRDIRNVVSFRRTTNTEIENCFTCMKKLNMVYPSWNSNSHRILILENESPIVFHISSDSELRNIGLKYKATCGGELGYCSICETEFVRMGKNHNLCEKHSSEKTKENWKNSSRRYRKNRHSF